MVEQLLDRPIAYHPCLVKLTGSVTSAVLLGQAMYWQKRCKAEDGWWWKKREDWTDETSLSRQELETARKRCSKYLLYEVRGVPATGWYKVDFEAIEADFSSWRETSKLVGGKPANKNAGNSQTSRRLSRKQAGDFPANYNTKSTSETSSKSTSGQSSLPLAGIVEEEPSLVPVKEAEKNSPTREFTDGWMAGYKEANGVIYLFQASKDGTAVARLLKTGIPPADLLKIAKRAWLNPTGFNCKQAASIVGFVNRFNEIQQELKNESNGSGKPVIDRNKGTFNETIPEGYYQRIAESRQ